MTNIYKLITDFRTAYIAYTNLQSPEKIAAHEEEDKRDREAMFNAGFVSKSKQREWIYSQERKQVEGWIKEPTTTIYEREKTQVDTLKAQLEQEIVNNAFATIDHQKFITAGGKINVGAEKNMDRVTGRGPGHSVTRTFDYKITQLTIEGFGEVLYLRTKTNESIADWEE